MKCLMKSARKPNIETVWDKLCPVLHFKCMTLDLHQLFLQNLPLGMRQMVLKDSDSSARKPIGPFSDTVEFQHLYYHLEVQHLY